MSETAKLALGVVGFLVGLYLISFHGDSNLFYVGLLVGVAAGGIIGEWFRNRHKV
jgi:hypothetical protein